MSRNICYICDFHYAYRGGQCDLCHGKCDKCKICENEYNRHNEIYDLSNEFTKKVEDSYNEIGNKASEIRDYLKKNYSIDINFSSHEDFLSRLKDKERELERNYLCLETKINLENNEQSNKKKFLLQEHQNDIALINQIFQTEKNKLIYKKDGELVKNKKKIICDLKQEKKSINKNKNSILENYIKEERKKADNIYNDRKAEIQKQNTIKEKDLKYSEEENSLKNEYSKKILKIKEIADKIPCYNNFIIQTGLNKYLN
jgi:hypothetical protein